MVQNWLEVEPRFSDPAVYTPAFRCAIQAGHFVKVLIQGIEYYGRIVSTSLCVDSINVDERPTVQEHANGAGFFKVNWYFKREELPLGDDAGNSSYRSNHNIYISSVDECFQTPWFNWILSSQVKELAFVFHYSDVISGDYCCSGIENAFFVRYRYSPKTVGCTYIDRNTYYAFPACYGNFWHYWSSCFSNDIWEATCLIQQTVTSILCRYGQSQGTNPSGHKKICISVSAINYLKLWLECRGVLAEIVSCHQMRTNIRDGVTYAKSKRIIKGFMFRFDTEEKLEVLCRLLGKYVVFGVRQRPPKLGTSYCVQRNDALNIVVGDTMSCRGVDILFNAPFADIYVRSQMFVVGGKAAVPTEKLRSALAHVVELDEVMIDAEQLSAEITLKINQRFQVGQAVYRINSIKGNVVTARCIFGGELGSTSEFPDSDVVLAIVNQLTN